MTFKNADSKLQVPTLSPFWFSGSRVCTWPDQLIPIVLLMQVFCYLERYHFHPRCFPNQSNRKNRLRILLETWILGPFPGDPNSKAQASLGDSRHCFLPLVLLQAASRLFKVHFLRGHAIDGDCPLENIPNDHMGQGDWRLRWSVRNWFSRLFHQSSA